MPFRKSAGSFSLFRNSGPNVSPRGSDRVSSAKESGNVAAGLLVVRVQCSVHRCALAVPALFAGCGVGSAVVARVCAARVRAYALVPVVPQVLLLLQMLLMLHMQLLMLLCEIALRPVTVVRCCVVADGVSTVRTCWRTCLRVRDALPRCDMCLVQMCGCHVAAADAFLQLQALRAVSYACARVHGVRARRCRSCRPCRAVGRGAHARLCRPAVLVVKCLVVPALRRVARGGAASACAWARSWARLARGPCRRRRRRCWSRALVMCTAVRVHMLLLSDASHGCVAGADGSNAA